MPSPTTIATRPESRPATATVTADATSRHRPLEKRASNFSFFLYLLYTTSYFAHLTARFDVLAKIHFDQIVAGVLILSLFAQQNTFRGRLDNQPSKILLGLLAYIIITMPFVEWPGSVLRDNFEVFLKGFVFFFFTVLTIDSEKRFKTFLFVFVVLQVYRVFDPLYLYMTHGYLGGRTVMGGEFVGRLNGAPWDIVNANGLAFVIVTAIPFLHYFLLNRGFIVKLTYAGILVGMLYALVLTMSRGGLIALLVILTAIFIQSRHKALFAIIALCGAVAIWVHLGVTQKDRYLSLTGAHVEGHNTAVGRINGLIKDLEIGLQRPVVGHGLGTSLEATVHGGGGYFVAHNVYLQALMELGTIGLIIYLLFFRSIYVSLRESAHLILRSRLETTHGPPTFSSFYVQLSMALRVVFWMYIVFSLNYFGVSDYYWYLLAGMAVALRRQIAEEPFAATSTSAVLLPSSKSMRTAYSQSDRRL